jgi:hypothetical protein
MRAETVWPFLPVEAREVLKLIGKKRCVLEKYCLVQEIGAEGNLVPSEYAYGSKAPGTVGPEQEGMSERAASPIWMAALCKGRKSTRTGS